MVEEKVKVKIKDKVRFIKKQIVFLPIALIAPIYFFHPSEKMLVTLFTIIVWHFLCFMSPVYMVKYLIEKVDFNQKFTDFVTFLSAIFMWVFVIYDWVNLFFFEGISEKFHAGLFVIPFIAFVKVGFGILSLTFLYKIYKFYKQIVED